MNMKQVGSSHARVLSIAFALLLVAALVPSAASALTPPASDPFYTQPANIARYPHGRSCVSAGTLSGPTQTEAAAAYQLMYATQRHRPPGRGGDDGDGSDLAGGGPAAACLLPDLLRQPDPQLRAVIHAAGRK